MIPSDKIKKILNELNKIQNVNNFILLVFILYYLIKESEKNIQSLM